MPLDDTAPKLADRRIPKGGDYLSADELAKLTPAELNRRVRELVPLIAQHAGEAERLRRPVDEVWQALRSSGFFYQFVPKRFGGMETDFDSFIDGGRAIAEVDASTAWVATFCAEHNWWLSHFPMETQEKLWGGDFPYIIAPVVSAPPGVAKPVEGGFVVSGRWKWGTGVMPARWFGVEPRV
jgi:alkylation response protein AidB-like acyl-CoA dehydrogenase